jgi:hyperosmotically inducible periplasmic protein
VKKQSLVKWAVGALTVLSMSAAYAQASDTEATASATMSPAPTAKEMRKANRLMSKRVRQALVKVKGLDSSAIVVIAKGDKITLGGSVPDASQIPLAVNAAQGVQGVSDVRNTLSIKQPGQ